MFVGNVRAHNTAQQDDTDYSLLAGDGPGTIVSRPETAKDLSDLFPTHQ